MMENSTAQAQLQVKLARALASSETQLCNVSRGQLEETSDRLKAVSRQLRMLLHTTAGALRGIADALKDSSFVARVRLPDALISSPEPSQPPKQMRPFLIAYGALFTILRRQPALLIEIVHRSGMAAAVALPILLCSVWGHLWRWDEERCLVLAAAHAVALRAAEVGVRRALEAGSLGERLCCTYLRMLPGGGAWLQAALGAELTCIIEESKHGLKLLIDPVDAYQSLSAEDRAEVDREVSAAAVGEHMKVMEMLSARSTALNAKCEAVLQALLASTPAAPRGLRLLCQLLQRRCRRPSDGLTGFAPSPAEAATDGLEGGDGGGALARELLLALLVAPAVACPEAYGVLLPAPVGREARRNLIALATALTRAAVLQPYGVKDGTPGGAPGGGGASAEARAAESWNLEGYWLQVDRLRELGMRCTAALVRGREGSDGGEQSTILELADSLAAEADATLGADRAPVALAAEAAIEAEVALATPPPLDVEIELTRLRTLHTMIEGKKAWLLGACGAREPLLMPLLEALQGATPVLAELGIIWDDEDGMCLSFEVGEPAVAGFGRKDAVERRERDSSSDSATAPEKKKAAISTDLGLAEAALMRLRHKLTNLFFRLPLASLHDETPPMTDGYLITDTPANLAADEGAEGASRAEATWASLRSVLSREAEEASAAGNDSQHTQVLECLGELDTIASLAQGEAAGACGTAPAAWVASVRGAVTAEVAKLTGKLASARAEWLGMARCCASAQSDSARLERSTSRMRLAHARAMLVRVLEEYDASVGRAGVLDAPVVPGAPVDPTGAVLDAGLATAVLEIVQAISKEAWWTVLSAREQSLTMCAIAAHWRPSENLSSLVATCGPNTTPLHQACSMMLAESDNGMVRLGVPVQRREWLRACAPAARELLRQANASAIPRAACGLLGELWRLLTEAPSVYTSGEGPGALDPLASPMQPTPADAAKAAAVDESASWAWLLLYCQDKESRRRARAEPSVDEIGLDADAVAAATLYMVPFFDDVVRGLEEIGSPTDDTTVDAGQAVALTMTAARRLLRAIEPLKVQSLLGQLMMGVEDEDEDEDEDEHGGDSPRLLKKKSVVKKKSSSLEAAPLPVHPWPWRMATLWERRWRLCLVRAQRDVCVLHAEGSAHAGALTRLRAAFVKLHAQQLACWVQSETLRCLTIGLTTSSSGANSLVSLSDDVMGFDEQKHAERHEHHDDVAALLDALRRQPRALAGALRRSGLMRARCPVAEQEAAVQMLLMSLYGNRTHVSDEAALMELIGALAVEGAPAVEGEEKGSREDAEGEEAAEPFIPIDVELRSSRSFFSKLVAAYFRMLSGGGAWLQATLGPLLAHIADESERGLRLLVEPMDAYLSLSPTERAEVDRDVEKGEVVAMDVHLLVVEVLSARSAALCAECEVLLQAVLSSVSSAPRGMRMLARTLSFALPSGATGALVALLYNTFVLPALTTPELYGLRLDGGEGLVSMRVRQNLSALATALEQLVSFVGEESLAQGSAPEGAKRYFSRRLLTAGPATAAASASALVEAPFVPPVMATLDEPIPCSHDAEAADYGADEADEAGGAGEAGEAGGAGGLHRACVPTEAAAGVGAALRMPRGARTVEAAGGGMIVRANEDEPLPLGLPGGAVVLTTSCLVTLLCFVRLHLHEQLPLPRTLAALLPDGLDEVLQESAASGFAAAAAAIAAVSSGMDILSKGTECWYERNGERKLATVLSVDYGDDPPFYVIRMD